MEDRHSCLSSFLLDQAIIGLEAAGSGYALSDQEKVKARGLMKNIQSHVSNGSTWNFPNDCRKPTTSGTEIVSCADFGYDPRMYRLGHFFLAPDANQPPWASGHVGNPPSGNYQSNGTCCASYPDWKFNDFNDNFSYGRFATYYDQAYTWYISRGNENSDRYLPFNTHNSQGYLDGVDNNGVAFGWACDADAPNSFVKVDFFWQGTKIPDDATQYAWFGSEPAVNSLCAGGTAHRFSVQLPSYVRGYQIEARARDYTFGPTLTLTCLESPACVW